MDGWIGLSGCGKWMDVESGCGKWKVEGGAVPDLTQVNKTRCLQHIIHNSTKRYWYHFVLDSIRVYCKIGSTNSFCIAIFSVP